MNTLHALTILGLVSSCHGDRPTLKSHKHLGVIQSSPIFRSIPDRLVFNHKEGLLGNLDTPRGRNVNKIISTFSDIRDVEFLDNAGCSAAIASVHSAELATYFNKEQTGMYKSDICRLAQLADKGGYYMDTDLEVMTDMRKIVPPQASFASVIALPWKGPRNPNELFQAFLGAAPRHPVILSSLDKYLDYYKGRNGTLSALIQTSQPTMPGTLLMRLAYEEWLASRMDPGLQEKAGEQTFKHSYLMEEDRLKPADYPQIKPQVGNGNSCGIAVFDRSAHKVLGYSHIVGVHDCQTPS